MSGIVGHTFYAILGRKLPRAAIAHRHFASYITGAYLDSHMQVTPEAIWLDTGREVGFGTVPLEKSPLTGGPVRQFRLATPEGPLTANQVHERFYGRSLLVFGSKKGDVAFRVPWDHLPDYLAAVSHRCAALASLPASAGPSWSEITAVWKG